MEYSKFWELENIERGLKSTIDDSLLNVYRVIKIKESINCQTISDPYVLLEKLKSTDVPFIKGDIILFFEIYKRISEMSDRTIIEYINSILSKGRFGAMVPECLFRLMFNNVSTAKTIFINDCDKYGVELYDFINTNKNIRFYLTIKEDILRKIFACIYKNNNVEFLNQDIYSYSFTTNKFDLIISFPVMGGREIKDTGDFISKDLSFIAVQNLLYHLTSSGKLIIILPAKIGFGSGDAEVLRHYISENYKVNEIASLPSKIFQPYMSINTYLLSISHGITDAVLMSKYSYCKNEKLNCDDERLLFSDELEEINNWNVDMAFSLTDETILKYKDSIVKKAKLKDVADVFRGKSVTEKVEDGNIAIINISNISETGIDYDNLETTNDEERKVARYLLEDGDVVMATKGFAIKVGVYEKQPRMVIASSNLCVIRPNNKILNGVYLKLFLESETGMKLIKSLQRGTTIVNINYQDICEIEVPVPPMDEQLEIVNEYMAGLNLYKKTIAAAEEAWSMIKNNVKKKLF